MEMLGYVRTLRKLPARKVRNVVRFTSSHGVFVTRVRRRPEYVARQLSSSSELSGKGTGNSNKVPVAQAAVPAAQKTAGELLRTFGSSLALWSAGGIASTAVLVKILSMSGLVYHPAILTPTAITAAVLFTVPLGAARGACDVAEYILVPATGQYAAQAWNAAGAAAENLGVDAQAQGFRQLLREQLNTRSLVSDVLNTSGVLGMPIRLALGAVLPNTDAIIDKLVASSYSSGASHSAVLVEAAANGVVAGHVATVRDNATTLALAALGLSIVAMSLIDQSVGRGKSKVQEAQDAAAEKVAQSRDALVSAGQTAGRAVGEASDAVSNRSSVSR